MSKYKYSEEEQKINNVLKHQSEELFSIHISSPANLDASISSSEELLHSLGYSIDVVPKSVPQREEKKIMILPSWEHLCAEAERTVGTDCELEELFTPDELHSNEKSIQLLNEEYNVLHRLDKFDIAISAAAGMLGAAVDILLVGIPKAGPDGLEAGPLSNFIRKKFDERFPSDEMEKLANSKESKVPYDAQDNRNTTEFAKYSYKQLRWVIIEKPEARDAFVLGKINEELAAVYASVNTTFDDFSKEYVLIIE